MRILFGMVFLAGGVVHLVLGRTAPAGYAAFGHTSLASWLAELWTSFVMPNIGWLTLVLGCLEIAIGALLLAGGVAARAAAVTVLGFFGFLLVLGHGFPAQTWVEDFLKNRASTLLMAGCLLPVLWPRRRSRP